MSRLLPWRRTCPEMVRERMEAALVARIYLLQQTGPTGFVVKEDGQSRTQKVCLGEMQSCTCAAFRRDKEICVHILWVLLKKLRLKKENPLVYQLSLVEREVNEILYSRANATVQSKPAQPTSSPRASGYQSLVSRKKVDSDDVCPICQDELLGSSEPLTFCKYSCGQNVHIKCMRVWAEHQISMSSDGTIRCPLCREDFGSLQSLKEEQHRTSRRKTRAERQNMHLGVTCNRCHVCPITGNCYRCTSCACYHLCHTCYLTPTHQHHSFEWRKGPSQAWRLSTQSRGVQLPPLLIAELQERELTEEDYNLLLQLDGTRLSTTSDHSQPEAPSSEHAQSRQGRLHRSNRSFQPLLLSSEHFLVARYSCYLCQRPFAVRQKVVQLLCSHWFHNNCLHQWTVHHSVCPIDNQPIRPALQQPPRASLVSGRLRDRQASNQPSLSERLSLSGQQLRLFLPAAPSLSSSTDARHSEASNKSKRAVLPTLQVGQRSSRSSLRQLSSIPQLAISGNQLQQNSAERSELLPENCPGHLARSHMTSLPELTESTQADSRLAATDWKPANEGEPPFSRSSTVATSIPGISLAPSLLRRRIHQQHQQRQQRGAAQAQRLLLPSANRTFQGSVQGLSVKSRPEVVLSHAANSSVD